MPLYPSRASQYVLKEAQKLQDGTQMQTGTKVMNHKRCRQLWHLDMVLLDTNILKEKGSKQSLRVEKEKPPVTPAIRSTPHAAHACRYTKSCAQLQVRTKECQLARKPPEPQNASKKEDPNLKESKVHQKGIIWSLRRYVKRTSRPARGGTQEEGNCKNDPDVPQKHTELNPRSEPHPNHTHTGREAMKPLPLAKGNSPRREQGTTWNETRLISDFLEPQKLHLRALG